MINCIIVFVCILSFFLSLVFIQSKRQGVRMEQINEMVRRICWRPDFYVADTYALVALLLMFKTLKLHWSWMEDSEYKYADEDWYQ